MLRPPPAVVRLSSWVVAHPRSLVAAWVVLLALAGASVFFRGSRAPAAENLLGGDQPVEEAEALAEAAFPDLYTTTDAVLVFARDDGGPGGGGLSDADLVALEVVARRLAAAGEAGAAGGPASVAAGPASRPAWVVHSHFLEPILAARLVARAGAGDLAAPPAGPRTAVMFVVSYDLPADGDESIRRLGQIESVARAALNAAAPPAGPAGLRMEVTGSAALAADQREAQDFIFHRVTFAAVLAVLAVLLLVYRAPLAASIPLLCVAASAFVATQALQLARSYGAPVGADELTYLVVIVFGAGTDFSLFWLSRYDEELPGPGSTHPDAAVRADAARRAYAATMPGILASAGTTILGLCALVASKFVPPHALGLAMAFALFVALLAAMTLMPALALFMGKSLFWPRRSPLGRDTEATAAAPPAGRSPPTHSHAYPRSRWAPLVAWVTRRPGTTVLLLLLALAGPLVRAARVPYQFETDPRILPDAPFARGLSLAKAHFGGAMMAPWTCLIQFDSDAALDHFVRPPQTAPASKPAGGLLDFLTGDAGPTLESRLTDVSAAAADALLRSGAKDVWHYAAPLGRHNAVGAGLARLLAPQALRYYWNPQYRCLRLEVMADDDPFSPRAVADFESAFAAVRASLAAGHVPAAAYAAGRTPFIANTKALSGGDEWRIKSAVTAVVALVVLLLLRAPVLTVVLILVTFLAYQATLGLCALVFLDALGHVALNWEVKMYAFVILMAVGQDYNLFLISRLGEESRHRPPREAVRHATVRTGGIISSCGLITAASLGALCTSGQYFLQQMGFALACGVLVDTFLVRPLLLPALLVMRGKEWGRGSGGEGETG